MVTQIFDVDNYKYQHVQLRKTQHHLKIFKPVPEDQFFKFNYGIPRRNALFFVSIPHITQARNDMYTRVCHDDR